MAQTVVVRRCIKERASCTCSDFVPHRFWNQQMLAGALQQSTRSSRVIHLEPRRRKAPSAEVPEPPPPEPAAPGADPVAPAP